MAQNKKLFREKQSIPLHVAVNLCHMNFLQMNFQNKIWLKVKRGCEKRIVPKKERPRVYNELKVFLSVIINLQ